MNRTSQWFLPATGFSPKSRFGLIGCDQKWGAFVRHRLVADDPSPPWFVIVMADRTYFWKSGDPSERFPDADLPTGDLLRRYLPAHWTKPEQWNHDSVMELAVSAWLGELSPT